jgi:methylenetetrahydrofolate reductase (NADPH)
VLAGDDPKVGYQPEAKPVYDLDSRALIALARKMSDEGVLPSGTPIEKKPELFIGAADVPCDPAPGWTPKALAAKAQAGADFVQTQFCMDIGIVRRYAARLRELGFRLPILIGIAPIPSARSARWMREKLFGSVIPDALVERLEKAADPKAEGRRICVELLRQLAEIPGIAGAHVMAPMNFAEIPAAIQESGVLNRKRAA